MNGNESIIELNDVNVVHEDAPDVVLVRGVNWRIALGEFWVVGGDQASGKTSLLATAACLNRPGSGTVRLFGRELAQATEAEQVNWRRRIGFVYEHGGRLFSHLTVAENVALPLEYHVEADDATLFARVDELLTLAELRPVRDLMPSRLNVRLQQRVGLVRALAVPTEVLFLDNPLGGLGARDMRWWLAFLRDLQSRHRAKGSPLTIAVACGEFRGWLDVASHFAIIENGEFRVIGGRDQVLASQEPAVKEFVASAI
jgi:phospholipid/cholesterol/gamma-HCH transport system ATP-binding protein